MPGGCNSPAPNAATAAREVPGLCGSAGRRLAGWRRHLGLTPERVVEEYCRTLDGKFSLREVRTPQDQYDCIFLKEQKASVGGQDGQEIVHSRRGVRSLCGAAVAVPGVAVLGGESGQPGDVGLGRQTMPGDQSARAHVVAEGESRPGGTRRTGSNSRGSRRYRGRPFFCRDRSPIIRPWQLD